MDIVLRSFIKDQADKKVDFVNDDMKIALFSGTYDSNVLKNKETYNDIAKYEVSALYGYTTGGLTVIDKSISVNNDTDEVTYDISDVSMTVTGGTFGPVRYGALYDVTNDNRLIYIFDFGEDRTVNDGAQFKIQIDANGLMKAKPVYSS